MSRRSEGCNCTPQYCPKRLFSSGTIIRFTILLRLVYYKYLQNSVIRDPPSCKTMFLFYKLCTCTHRILRTYSLRACTAFFISRENRAAKYTASCRIVTCFGTGTIAAVMCMRINIDTCDDFLIEDSLLLRYFRIEARRKF